MEEEVAAAFGLLIEELNKAEEEARNQGAEALKSRDDARLERLAEYAKQIADFRKKVEGLAKEWKKLGRGRSAGKSSQSAHSRQRLPRMARTPEQEFRRPILEELVALGGSAPAGKVLDGVYKRMRNVLKPADKETLPSSPTTPRWRNTAQWARNSLVTEGLMSSTSPHGVWEITEQGRKWLENH